MHTTSTPTTARPVARRRRLALLVAPALALVITVGCGSDDPSNETAVMGATADRPSEGTLPADRPIDAGSRPRRIIAESTDRAAPVGPADALHIGGVRVVAESTDRVAPVGPADETTSIVGSRYAGQAAAYEASDDTPDEAPDRPNGPGWVDRRDG